MDRLPDGPWGSLWEVKRIFGLAGLRRGGGRLIRPSAAIRNIATRQDISLRPPSALNQAKVWQVKRESSARVR